jgi:hypothetical protein
MGRLVLSKQKKRSKQARSAKISAARKSAVEGNFR